ncbi:hypothetical protein McanMca71_005368 [Microsporum canis]|uniref:NADH dehydrogenase [ubiquinone] 1 beta subcomplex subunit 4 n=1 Tax=Arthroderma otae (strain ATCC MYA-4605 / CBS 113480) TaxID=554155 RepID=C5G1C5_ARTOC|nr:NADH:ubiquinone oxidoreductase 6.6kD subunit [Microsporum canis CBS 113480]EEQ28588.1 NADH:ubiquinone oxidoreductase 6.6kD subunit [Microsporum canis CBS 113480]
MAGPSNIHLDPALQKYYDTHKNRYKYFRWTPRTAWISFCYMAVVPGIIGYIAYKTDGKYDFRGKRRGDTIAEW